jgi:hypothetical protein
VRACILFVAMFLLSSCSSTVNRSRWVDEHCESVFAPRPPAPEPGPRFDEAAERGLLQLAFGWIRWR